MLNKIQFIGFLGRDPEVKYLPSGSAVCNFSVASTEKWKKDGERHERTEWLRCNAFDKLAEICGEWLKKGSLVYVEGSLQTRTYEKDGVERSVTECRLSSMKMLGGRPSDDEREGGGQRTAPQAQRQASAPRPTQQRQSGGFDNMDDDIPF